MNLRVLTFYINEDLFGIDINNIKELNRNIEYTNVPDTHEYIEGLFNMRGQIVTVFNLNKILKYENIEKNGKQKRKTCITLKTTDKLKDYVGFLIDQTGDVLDIDEKISEAPPANMNNIKSRFVKLVAKSENELITILDPEEIFKVEYYLKSIKEQKDN